MYIFKWFHNKNIENIYALLNKSYNDSNFMKSYRIGKNPHVTVNRNELVNKFKTQYNNLIVSDVGFKQLKTYVKVKGLDDGKDLKNACGMLIEGKFITNAQYEELLHYVKSNRGNEVWQTGLHYVIDFWNIKFDGMDDCFFTCCGIKNKTIKTPDDIFDLLTGPIHQMHNCCAVREYLLKQKN